jgi:hypothetical protein
LRSTRALTDRPISASSAAACAAVPRTFLPVEDSEASARGGVGGTPAGWAGWRRRSGRGADSRRVAGASRRAVGASRRGAGVSRRGADVLRALRARGARVPARRFDGPDEPLPVDGPPFAGTSGDKDADGWAGEARLSLRRCGRLCGSAPRTSEGRSSVNRSQSWRNASVGAFGTRSIAKSEQNLKPARRLRVYV